MIAKFCRYLYTQFNQISESNRENQMGNTVDMNRIMSYKQMNDALGNYDLNVRQVKPILKRQSTRWKLDSMTSC